MLVRLACGVALAIAVMTPHGARAQNCAEEISKLREIKDIQDELQMIDDVFLKQTKAIRALDVALGYSDVPVPKALRTLKKDNYNQLNMPCPRNPG